MMGVWAAALLLLAPTSDGTVDTWFPGGSGVTSCATWLSDRDHISHGSEWIAGYWTGLNINNEKNHLVGHTTDVNGIIAEVKLLCQAEPSALLMSAIWRVYLRMEKEGR